MNFNLNFYNNKKVFITGHTGFKGSWLCKMLTKQGAIVTGYSKGSKKKYSLYDIANISQNISSVFGDIRDYKTLKAAFDIAQQKSYSILLRSH